MSLDIADAETWVLGIAGEAWIAFLELRKAKQRQAPLTPLARKRILFSLRMMAADGQDVSEVLWTSVTNGWTGIYPIKRKGWQAPTLAQTQPNKAVEQTQDWIKEHGAPVVVDKLAVSERLRLAKARILSR